MSPSSGLCVSHTEDVVSLHSSIDTAVAWDGVSVLRGLVARLFNAIENFQSVFFSLFFLGLIGSFFIVEAEEGLLVLLKLLLLDDIICFLCINTEEFINSLGRNRLLQVIDLEEGLLSYKNLVASKLPLFEQLSRAAYSDDAHTLP